MPSGLINNSTISPQIKIWQQNIYSRRAGDGIGQGVTSVGKAVLEKIAYKYGHTFTYDDALMGHVAIEATGNPLPEETLTKMLCV